MGFDYSCRIRNVNIEGELDNNSNALSSVQEIHMRAKKERKI